MAEPAPTGRDSARANPTVLEGERMSEREPLPQGVARRDSWLAALDRHRVQFVVLDKERDGTLMSLVRSQSDWTVDFENEVSVLFSRGPAEEH